MPFTADQPGKSSLRGTYLYGAHHVLPKENNIKLLFKQVTTGGNVNLGQPLVFPFSNTAEPKEKTLI